MSDKPTAEILDALVQVIAARSSDDPEKSYSAQLLANAPEKPLRKLSEETTELMIEILKGDAEAAVLESADLLYHLLVVWQGAGVSADAVWAALAKRQGLSGIDEKNSRGA